MMRLPSLRISGRSARAQALEVQKSKTLESATKYVRAAADSVKQQRLLLDEFKQDAYDVLGKTVKDWKTALDLARDPKEPNFAELQDFYEGISIDGHLRAVRGTLQKNILSKRFLVVIDGKVDEELTALIENKAWFRSYCINVLDAEDYGYSLMEFKAPVDGEFRDLVLVPRRHVNPVFRQVNPDPYSSTNGIAFDKATNANFLMYAQGQNYLGLLNAASPQVCLKKLAQQYWARYMELFGIPFRTIRVNREDEPAREAAEALIRDMGSAFGMVLGPDEELDVKEPSNRDAFNVFQKMEERRDAEISKIFLGQTLTTEGGGDGATHFRILQAYERDRLAMLTIHINDYLKPFLVLHGYPAQLEKARIVPDQLSGLSPQQLMTIWAEGAQFGLRPKKEAIEKLLGVELEEMDGVAGSTSKQNIENHYHGMPSAADSVIELRSLYEPGQDSCCE